MLTKLHHSGMMVKDLGSAIKANEVMGFKVEKSFEKPGMKAAMMIKDDFRIELFEFENPDGELESKIKKHTAFVSDDLENDLQKYLDMGYELAIPIDTGRVVTRYAYVKDNAGNFIELLEP